MSTAVPILLRSDPRWAVAPASGMDWTLQPQNRGDQQPRASFGSEAGVASVTPARSASELRELVTADILGVPSAFEFFRLFYSDKSDFSAEYHHKRMDTDFSCTAWSRQAPWNDDGNAPVSSRTGRESPETSPLPDSVGLWFRLKTHHSPVRAVVGPRRTRLEERQCMSMHGTTLVIQSVVLMPDVPYGDCFQVEMLNEVSPVQVLSREPAVRLSVSLGVFFHKNTMFAPKIRNDSWKEALSSFQLFISLARQRAASLREQSPLNARASGDIAEKTDDSSELNSGIKGRAEYGTQFNYSSISRSADTLSAKSAAWTELLRVLKLYIIRHQAFVMAYVLGFFVVLFLYVRVMDLTDRVSSLETALFHATQRTAEEQRPPSPLPTDCPT